MARCVPGANEASFSLLPGRGQVTQGLEESPPTAPLLFQLHRENTEFHTSNIAVLAEGITVDFGLGKQSPVPFFK